MKPSRPLATLFHPFESGAIATPADGRFLFLGAEPGFRLPEGFTADLHLVQGFRPHFRALEAARNRVSALPEGVGYDGALVLAGRHRGRNELWLAEAITGTKPDGLIVVAGSKEDGIESLRKRLENKEDALADRIAGRSIPPAVFVDEKGTVKTAPERLYNPVPTSVPLGGHLSKFHGMAFWLQRTPQADAFANAMKKWYGHWPLIDGSFSAAPGMFSHDRIDAGSKLLVECLPETAEGTAADFGAGWGYLSAMLAERTKGLASIDLYEADYESLEAAKRNLADIPPPPAFGFFWHDLVGETVDRKYDLIVMNPPFHQGRAAEPGIGQAMIGRAASALKPGGRLLMVANRGLPYAQTLQAAFKKVEELRDENGFRVFSAIR